MKITLTNNFHNTESSAFAQEHGRGHYHLSASQVRHLRKRLCPRSDCSCGGILGERGRQEQQFDIIPGMDGSVDILA